MARQETCRNFLVQGRPTLNVMNVFECFECCKW